MLTRSLQFRRRMPPTTAIIASLLGFRTSHLLALTHLSNIALNSGAVLFKSWVRIDHWKDDNELKSFIRKQEPLIGAAVEINSFLSLFPIFGAILISNLGSFTIWQAMEWRLPLPNDLPNFLREFVSQYNRDRFLVFSTTYKERLGSLYINT